MGLFSQIKEDFTSVYNNDPAIHSRLELFFNYPGVWAIAAYRLANRLHRARGIRIVFCVALGVAIVPYLLFGSNLIDSV